MIGQLCALRHSLKKYIQYCNFSLREENRESICGDSVDENAHLMETEILLDSARDEEHLAVGGHHQHEAVHYLQVLMS